MMLAPCNYKVNRIKADKLLQSWLASIPGVVINTRAGFSASVGNKWPIDCPQFTLNTELGVLDLTPASSHGTLGYVCYGCFAEPKRAAAVIGRDNMNDYSGKWNHYSFAGSVLTPEQFAAFVSFEIHDHCMPTSTSLPFNSNVIIIGKDIYKAPPLK